MSFINVSPFHEFLSGMNFILQINVGVVKLTGETGTGKTSLLQELVRGTTQAHQDIVAFYSAPASFQEIKDSIRERLDLDPAIDFHDALLVYLLARSFEQRRLILVFDNAEGIDAETLIAIGQLRSIQHAGHNLIGMVLCGKPELNRILRNPEHRQLANDILLSYELSPLSSQQLPDFCRACLAARGLDGFVLVSDDYQQIMQKSGGLPGKVAELVETYWPEDMETAEPAGKNTAGELPPLATVELRERLQAALIQTTTPAAAKPDDYLRPARKDVVFEVTPVVAPDIGFENPGDIYSDAAPGSSAEGLVGVASEPSCEIGSSSGVPSRVPFDLAADASPDTSSGNSADAAFAVSPDAPSILTSNGPCEISYNFSYEISYGPVPDTVSDVPVEAPVELPADIATDAFTEASSDKAIELPPIITAAISADPGPISANAGPSSAASAAASIAPDPVSSAPASRQQIVIGSLLAASVVIAVVISYMRDPAPAATQPVASVEPVPAAPAQAVETTVPAVVTQQFGDTPATTAAQAAAGTEQAMEIVSLPVGTETPADATEEATANTTTQPPAADNTSPTAVVVSASPASPAAIATVAEAVVTAWTNAWQNQDVAAYLAYYHADFVPPNQASLETWQNSRRRTITSQSSISITVEDFEVVDNSGSQATVQFLLTYRGDTYADRTVKQLVLQPDTSGELRILQEQNLQTEVFDPVIEDASSWMTDVTPTETAAMEARNNEPAASELIPDDPFPLAGSSEPAVIQHKPDDATTLLAASATEIPTSREPVTTDTPVNISSGSPAAVTATIPLIFNLTTLSPQEVQQINDSLMQWVQAWQQQDTDQYFAHYHPDYNAPESPTITAWHEERIGKITAPAAISISLSELEILENNDNNILIELLMEYRADSYADRTTKRMLLSKSATAAWLITMEKNLEVEVLQ